AASKFFPCRARRAGGRRRRRRCGRWRRGEASRRRRRGRAPFRAGRGAPRRDASRSRRTSGEALIARCDSGGEKPRFHLLVFPAMQLDLTTSVARGASTRRVAFLREAANPSDGAPTSVRAALARAVKAASFRGRSKELALVSDRDGPWILVGLGKDAVSPGKL